MLDDAVKQRQAEGGADGVRVMDIAQVLEQSVAAHATPGTAQPPANPGPTTNPEPTADTHQPD